MLSSFNGSERVKSLFIQCVEARRNDGEVDFDPLVSELPATDPPLAECGIEEFEVLLVAALQLPFGLLDLAGDIGMFAGMDLDSFERDEQAEDAAMLGHQLELLRSIPVGKDLSASVDRILARSLEEVLQLLGQHPDDPISFPVKFPDHFIGLIHQSSVNRSENDKDGQWLSRSEIDAGRKIVEATMLVLDAAGEHRLSPDMKYLANSAKRINKTFSVIIPTLFPIWHSFQLAMYNEHEGDYTIPTFPLFDVFLEEMKIADQ